MRSCLVVGGNGGIGAAIVGAFISAGYQVIFTYRVKNDIVKKLVSQKNCFAYCVDAVNENDIMQLRENIENKGINIDVDIYAAGIFQDSLIEEMTYESWKSVMETNLGGAFLFAKYFLKMLRKSGNGRYVAIGSVMGESGCYGSSSYSASKAALIGFVKSLALENARFGVTGNVISPGYVDAGMTNRVSEKVMNSVMKKIPMKQLGDPKEMARIVVDLCSEYTSYLSGQVIRYNGLLYV